MHTTQSFYATAYNHTKAVEKSLFDADVWKTQWKRCKSLDFASGEM